MKLIRFELFGDYGHFKKFYTTSSPLTFSFPPPPTIKGILGAILGLDKTNYLEILSPSQCKVGISIRAPIKRIRVGFNHINTKGGYWGLKMGRTQIRTELLKDPKFLIYIWLADELLFQQLETQLKNHQTVYTISLGLSEMLADFRWIDSFTAEYVENAKGSICSILPIPELDNVHFQLEPGRRYLKERIPIIMNQERIVSLYQDVMIEKTGQPFQSTAKNLWRIGDDQFVYLF